MHRPRAPRRRHRHLSLTLAALLVTSMAVGQAPAPPATAAPPAPTPLLLADEPLYRAFDRLGERFGVHVYYHPDDVPFYTTSLAQGDRSLVELLQAATRGTNLLAVKYDADTYVVAPEGRQSRAYADEVVAGWRSGRYRSLDDRVRPAISTAISQDTLRGRVVDAETEEPLFGATVFDPLRAAGTSTGFDGVFALALPAGDTHRLELRLLGYELQPLVVAAAADRSARDRATRAAAALTLELHPQVTGLEEVVVTARDGQRLQREAAGGVRAVSLRELRALPALTGDLDVLQALTVTAGVGQAAEGSAGITVRGGGLDQNLILQGGMPVLYPAHALGFFPVFHPDLVGGVDLYRGYVPPAFGGRAASVVDVAWRTGDMQRWRARGAAGPFASRLSVEGPLVRERVSLLVGGRASHLNWALDRVRNRDVRTSSVSFADVSAQVTGRWTGGKVDVQGAYATDDFTYAARFGYRYTNASGRVAVNQRLADGWLGRVEASRSTFADEQVELRVVPGPSAFTTGLTLDRARAAVRYEIAGTRGDGEAGALALEGGVELSRYTTPPRALVPETGSLAVGFAFRDPSLRNAAAYVQARYAPSARTVVEGGVRASAAESRRAPGVRYRYDGPPALGQVRETGFSDSETAHRLPAQLEPRVSVTHDLNEALTLGVAYSRLVQPVSQLTPTVTPTPTDVFLLASEHLALTTSQGVSATLASRPSRGERSLGAEVAGYYRRTRANHLAREGTGLRASDAPERSVYTAPGYAYGGELTLRAVGLRNRVTVSYAYGRSWIAVDARYPEQRLRPARRFPAPTDLPHQVNVNYTGEPSGRVSYSLAWTLTSGRPFTATDGLVPVAGTLVPTFGGINRARLPPTHRLDLGFRLDNSAARRRGLRVGFGLSVYNVYARANPFLAFYRFDTTGRLAAYQFAIVGEVIPAANLTFQWD